MYGQDTVQRNVTDVCGQCSIDHAEMAEPITATIGAVMHIGATWQIRLNDYARRL